VGPDGAPLEHCGNDLDGPGVTSTCEACGTDADDCQPNGCYGDTGATRTRKSA